MSKNRSFRPRNKLSFDEDEGQEDAGSGVKPPAQSKDQSRARSCARHTFASYSSQQERVLCASPYLTQE